MSTYKVGDITYDSATGRPITSDGKFLLDVEKQQEEIKNNRVTPKPKSKSQRASRGGVLRYPYQALTAHTDYLQIDIVEYKSVKQSSGSLTHRFDIAPNGTLTGTDTDGIGNLSDQRLKTNIQDYTYDLNKFKQLKTRTFDWINPEFHREGNQRGFIAQEIETVDPYWNYQFEVSKETAKKDYDLLSDGDENMARFTDGGSVELYHANVKIFETTGIGITVGLSSIQHNGNAAFPGITTLGKPGAGSEVIINNRLTVNSGANITGIATLAQAYIAKLAQSNGTSGSVNEVPVANGSGGWSWAPVNTAGASVLQGITVQEEGSNVGTAGSIATLNFVGGDVTADATAQQGICTVTIDSSIQGITTSGTSFLHDITQTGVTTLTSDQQAAFNVGTAATIYSAGNIRTVGVITAHGGLVVGDTTDASSGGGLLVGTAGTIQSNGAAAFAGIVTAGGGFNIGIQSAGIVIAKNVGINTLNFVGSGNSITYFAATNTLDVSIAGSSGGGGGGVSETETAVSSTSATTVLSFAKATYRAAFIKVVVTQGSAYQSGKYSLIHDGTTVTVVEENAIATGSMLGSFSGTISGDNVLFQVTMGSASSATVIVKADKISA